jgi:hypothetical protein
MNIYYITGYLKQTLYTFADNFSEAPKLIWLEPRPTLINGQIGLKEVGLKNAFQGLRLPLETKPWFEIPDGVFIEEARFCWQNSMLHLLAEEEGYRYFACSENEGLLNDLKLGEEKSKQVDVHTGKNQVSKIFLRHDLKRFNLGDTLKIGEADKVQVVSYWYEDSLWAWRLIL